MSEFDLYRNDTAPEHGGGKGLKIAKKGAIIAIAGGISNTSWGLAIGLNRLLESKNTDTTIPAIAFALGTTAVEYGLTYAVITGDLDVEWHPKRRFTTWVKRHLGKIPLAVTAWRGAASGVVIDQIAGREITQGRRLAHSVLYGGLVGGWVSSAGSLVLSKGLDVLTEIPNYAIEHPIQSAIALIGGVSTAAYGMQIVEPEISEPFCIQTPQA